MLDTDSQHPGPGFHPNSRRHLRPPWKPGQSGNPAGKPRGTRNLRTHKYERLGRRIADSPSLAAVVGAPRLDDRAGWRRLYRETLGRLRANPATRDQAITMAERELVSLLFPWIAPEPRSVTECAYCRVGLHMGRHVTVPVPVAACTWVHDRCVIAFHQKLEQEARQRLAKILA